MGRFCKEWSVSVPIDLSFYGYLWPNPNELFRSVWLFSSGMFRVSGQWGMKCMTFDAIWHMTTGVRSRFVMRFVDFAWNTSPNACCKTAGHRQEWHIAIYCRAALHMRKTVVGWWWYSPIPSQLIDDSFLDLFSGKTHTELGYLYGQCRRSSPMPCPLRLAACTWTLPRAHHSGDQNLGRGWPLTGARKCSWLTSSLPS